MISKHWGILCWKSKVPIAAIFFCHFLGFEESVFAEHPHTRSYLLLNLERIGNQKPWFLERGNSIENTQLFRTLKLAMMLVWGHLPVQFCRLTVLQWVETLVPATRTFRRTERNKAQRTVPAHKKKTFFICQLPGWLRSRINLPSAESQGQKLQVLRAVYVQWVQAFV
mgnify:CR=1 FL=1